MGEPFEIDIAGVRAAMGVLRNAVCAIDPGSVSPQEAVELVEALSEGERVCAAGRTVAGRIVERSGAWRRDGHRTPAHWMAGVRGVAVGQAVGTLETARRLEALPATARAFCSGRLSEAKAREVAAAAEVRPHMEGDLLEVAQAESVVGLRERCRRVRAEATDPEEAHLRIHRGRYLRNWTDHEGAFRLELRTTPTDGAKVLAGLAPHRRRIFAQARTEGRREPTEAYAADALVAMASEQGAHRAPSPPGPPAVVHVRVDRGAFLRGRTEPGEVCEIPGIAPIPVPQARELARDAVMKLIVTEGADVVAVRHLGRGVPSRLRTAIEARDPTCVVPRCDAREGLEIDHIRGVAPGRPPSPTWPGCVATTIA